MHDILCSYGISFERISAVDAQKFSESDVLDMRTKSEAVLTMSVGDLACGCSHLLCLEKIARGDEQYGAILEDDLHLASDIGHFLNNTEWIPSGAGIVKLETFDQETKLARLMPIVGSDRKIAKLMGPHLGAGIYVISRAAAQLILNDYYAGKNYIDVYMFETNLNKLDVYQVTPAPAVQDKFINPGDDNFLSSGIHGGRVLVNPEHFYVPPLPSKPKGMNKIKRELFRIPVKLYKKTRSVLRYYFYKIFYQVELGSISYRD